MTGPRTILVVDDSPTQLSVLVDALEELGYTVRGVGNGMEAISTAFQTQPDLILSDVVMPELNGYHLCRLLKNDPFTAHIPVILLTNLTEKHDRFWGEHAGADLYLEKTSDLEAITGAVAGLLKSTPDHPRNFSGDPSPPHPGKADVKARLTGILDRLLYESTVSNEILKLTGMAHNPDLLAREFLGFLEGISHFSAAALLLREGSGKYLVGLHLAEPVSADFIERSRKEIFLQAGLPLPDPARQRHLVFHGEGFSPSREKEEGFHLLQALPIRDGDELLGAFALFSRRERPLTPGLRHSLKVVADRFLVVARYLSKFRETEEVKADFISMLVHDLRSPLTSIKGFTDVLAEGILGAITPEQRDALENIQGGCERLLGLIEGILDLSKLEAGKMALNRSPILLEPLARRVVADLSALFLEKKLRVVVEVDPALPPILVEEKQLARVFTNLLTNAAKFTPQEGTITLRGGVSRHCPPTGVSDCLEVAVEDTGIGIPADLQQALFARYQQLPSTLGLHRNGTGLGLAICKEIITLHEGTIWVESPVTEGGGSRFVFTIPLA